MFWPQVSYNLIQTDLLLYRKKSLTAEWKLLQRHKPPGACCEATYDRWMHVNWLGWKAVHDLYSALLQYKFLHISETKWVILMSKYCSYVSGYVSFSLWVLSPVTHQDSLHACEDCDSSCLECRGPGPANCTTCPIQAILETQGRCLLCCRHEQDEEEAATQQQDCCNCTETRGRLGYGKPEMWMWLAISDNASCWVHPKATSN